MSRPRLLISLSGAAAVSDNITLCFSQERAAAVYSAAKGARQSVCISPFVGRLDDRGQNGMDLVKNIKNMYEKGDGHVLTASIRKLEHLLSLLCSDPEWSPFLPKF